VFVLRLPQQRVLGCWFIRPFGEKGCGHRPPIRTLVRVREQANQLVFRTGFASFRRRNPARPFTAWTVHVRAIPVVCVFHRPIRRFVGVAAIAGVRDVQFLGQQRIGNGETMIVARVPLHVHRHRQVAADTFAALARELVVTVAGSVYHRRFRIPAVVAFQAQIVAVKLRFRHVAGVAVKARHAGLVHLAAEERGKFVILVLYLSVRIPALRIVQNFERVVIVKGVAGSEVARQIGVARMAGSAQAHDPRR